MDKKSVCIGDVITFLDSRVARGLFIAVVSGSPLRDALGTWAVITWPESGYRPGLRRGVPPAANVSRC